ncbi:MAG TPA: glycosyltransferase N-terminal domain-containing protein, partial [Alphaproteobacteria bacterium]
MILSFYSILMSLCGPLLRALLFLRRLQGLEEKNHVREKTGIATLPKPLGKLIWIHAASNGEMLSSLPLVKKILASNSDAVCLITTVTVTAARLTRRENNPRILHQYAPIDH